MFRVDIVDGGEPSSSDHFRIRLTTGYDSGDEDALMLVHLYVERGSPKAEPAARRLVRYLTEGTPSMRDVAN